MPASLQKGKKKRSAVQGVAYVLNAVCPRVHSSTRPNAEKRDPDDGPPDPRLPIDPLHPRSWRPLVSDFTSERDVSEMLALIELGLSTGAFSFTEPDGDGAGLRGGEAAAARAVREQAIGTPTPW